MEVLTRFLDTDLLGTAAWIWLSFGGTVTLLLAFDLGLLHRSQRDIGVRESLFLSAGYVGVAIGFGAWIWAWLGPHSASAYLAGWLIEKSLSMDNVFVIALAFSFFGVPRQYQHRALFWGVVGVIVLRGILIAVGASLISRFDWLLTVFGAVLLFTGIRMWMAADQAPDIAGSRFLAWLRSRLRLTDRLHGSAFLVRLPHPSTGRPVVWATPLLLALILIEFFDLLFAFDSLPAVFAVSSDPFVVYTSNIFAVLGVRALYFALAAMIHRFTYLKYALALVLGFIGSKILLAGFVGEIPAAVSLTVTFGLLLGGVLVSLRKTQGKVVVPGAI